MASSLESNRRRTCCSVSGELVHPMSGSTALGEVCSKSSTHDLVLAVPACIAVLAGLYMRAVMIGGALRRISLLSPAGIQEPAQRSRRHDDLPPALRGGWRETVAVPARCGVGLSAHGAARR